MTLMVRSNATPLRSLPSSRHKAKRQRYIRASTRRRKHFGGARQWLVAISLVAIMLLMIFQLTAMTQHMNEGGEFLHQDHADPRHYALKEQKLQHEGHLKEEKRRQEEATADLLLQRQKEDENMQRAKEQRRRLNSTRGNRSATVEGMQKVSVEGQKQPVLREKSANDGSADNQRSNGVIRVGSDPTRNQSYLQKSKVHVVQSKKVDGQNARNASRQEELEDFSLGADAIGSKTKRQKRVSDSSIGQKSSLNVTGILSINDNTNMTVTYENRTGNLTRSVLVRKPPTLKPRRPFRFKRSIPAPPSDFGNRSMPMDPLDPHFNISALTPLNYTLKSRWHGLLLDAGRHYFDIDWLKRMLDILHVLQYNALHLRLTDDQAFNVKLDSQPDLAHNVGLFGNDRTYTPTELRDLVTYAKTKNITIWPEINVPGHGGGWAGIPGLIVQCPEFICEKGYGVPINVTHPKFREVLTDVLREVIDIFDQPPFLHLGGDEVDMAAPCFQELDLPMFNYDIFERSLKSILADINYPEEQVIRWEMTGQRLKSPRTGKVPQHWFRVPGESAPDLGRNNFLASGGLYFDFNEMDMAWQIYLATRRYYHLPRDNFPVGIVAGTFELNAQFWYDRNIVGRLLAVTMGAAQEVYADDGNELYEMYHKTCRAVGFEDSLCNHYGLPFISWKEYKDKWSNVWTKWKDRICDRLTFSQPDTIFIGPEKETNHYHHRYPVSREGSSVHSFWDVFGTNITTGKVDLNSDKKFSELKQQLNLSKLINRLVPNAGIVLDVTLPDQDTHILAGHSSGVFLEMLHSFGFNLLQLRLASDHGIGYLSELVPHAMPHDRRARPSIQEINETFVTEATRLEIGVIPEIAVTTNAAGWYHMGFNVQCPLVTCRKGQGVQDISEPSYTAVAYRLVREVEKIATSGMIHLGSDERKSGEACFSEVTDTLPNFASFEKKLAYLLEYDGIGEQVIRWANEEGVKYPGRLGHITQCRKGDCRTENTGRWIATVDLQVGGPYHIYTSAKELALRKPWAIIAEAGNVDTSVLGKDNLPKRMLAFAMGISEMDEWSRGMFEESFTRLCFTMLGSGGECSDFAKSNSGVDEAAFRSEVHREALCSERTRNITRHIYRPEFQEKVEAVEVKPN